MLHRAIVAERYTRSSTSARTNGWTASTARAANAMISHANARRSRAVSGALVPAGNWSGEAVRGESDMGSSLRRARGGFCGGARSDELAQARRERRTGALGVGVPDVDARVGRQLLRRRLEHEGRG